jgi:alpha-tubulin suppressor-like RCC1 family protein
LEAPFVDGELSLSGSLGQAVDADFFLFGVRIANLSAEMGAGVNATAEGTLAYAMPTFGEPMAGQGNGCLSGSLGAGAVLGARVGLGIELPGLWPSVGFNYSLQVPTPEEMLLPGRHALWWTGPSTGWCYPAPQITAVSAVRDLGVVTVSVVGTDLPADLSMVVSPSDQCTAPTQTGASASLVTFTCTRSDPSAVTLTLSFSSSIASNLGGLTASQVSVPASVNAPLSSVVSVSAGYFHTCALLNTGAVKCWGENWSGQLGDGTTTDRYTPVSVSGLDSGVTAISLGGDHSCALLNTGAVKCWGDNFDGQLGDGTTTNRHTPVAVSGLDSGVTAISLGRFHSCALRDTGAVKCWGDNYSGALGDGTTTDRTTPVAVSGLGSGVTAISLGGEHTCALLNSGAVKCWGDNYVGQLGDGTTTNRYTPVAVSGLGSGVTAVSLGAYHSCALVNTGAVKCWGDNNSGQLGDGTQISRYTPVAVSGLGSGVTAISLGWSHSCALLNSGAVKCLGDNDVGQLGDGTTIDRYTPVAASGLGSGVTAVSLGADHSCALVNTGAVKCWGDNSSGQLGDSTTIDRHIPITVLSGN